MPICVAVPNRSPLNDGRASSVVSGNPMVRDSIPPGIPTLREPRLRSSTSAPRPVPGQLAGGDYVYDWVGNRIRPPDGTGNEMVYNEADQLVMWPGMHGRWNGSTLVPGYVYDSAGNLTAVKNLWGSSNLATYTYTEAGLLDTASYGGRTRRSHCHFADTFASARRQRRSIVVSVTHPSAEAPSPPRQERPHRPQAGQPPLRQPAAEHTTH